MDVRIIVETTFEDGRKRSHRLDRVSRPVRQVGPENVGITMKDAQNLLRGIQETVLRNQIDEISEASRICPDCNKVRAIHDYRSRVFDTLFGRFRVKVPRIRHCNCSVKSEVELSGPFSPFAHVFPDRSTLELHRLQAELGARHSFREAARIMETFLPCARQMNTTVRNRLGKIAQDISGIDRAQSAVDEDGMSPPLTTVPTSDVGQNTNAVTLMSWWERSKVPIGAVASVWFSRRRVLRPGNSVRLWFRRAGTVSAQLL